VPKAVYQLINRHNPVRPKIRQHSVPNTVFEPQTDNTVLAT